MPVSFDKPGTLAWSFFSCRKTGSKAWHSLLDNFWKYFWISSIAGFFEHFNHIVEGIPFPWSITFQRDYFWLQLCFLFYIHTKYIVRSLLYLCLHMSINQGKEGAKYYPQARFPEEHQLLIAKYIRAVVERYYPLAKNYTLASELIDAADWWASAIVEAGYSEPRHLKNEVNRRIKEIVPDAVTIVAVERVPDYKPLREYLAKSPHFENLPQLFDKPFSVDFEDVKVLIAVEKANRAEWSKNAYSYSPSVLMFMAYCYHVLRAEGVIEEVLEKYRQMALCVDKLYRHNNIGDTDFNKKRGTDYQIYYDNLIKAAMLLHAIGGIQNDVDCINLNETHLNILFENLNVMHFADPVRDKIARFRRLAELVNLSPPEANL